MGQAESYGEVTFEQGHEEGEGVNHLEISGEESSRQKEGPVPRLGGWSVSGGEEGWQGGQCGCSRGSKGEW